MCRVSFPMQWTSAKWGIEMEGRSCLRFLWFSWALAVTGSAWAQEHAVTLKLEGLAYRPYRISEFHPLTATRSVVQDGQADADGELTMTWPDDGRLHFMELESAGILWSVPVLGPMEPGWTLEVPPPGRAPMASRPGLTRFDGSGDGGVIAALAECEGLVARHVDEIAADLQRALLWEGMDPDAKRKAGGLLGAPMEVGGGNEAEVDRDSALVARVAVASASFDSLVAGSSVEALGAYVDAMRWRVLPELHPDRLVAFRQLWRQRGAPDPSAADEVLLFREGLERFADVDAMSREDRATLGRAWSIGDMDSLVVATTAWWGREDRDMTAAWFLARLGDGGFGYTAPRRFGRSRPLPPAMAALLDELNDHPLLGEAAVRLAANFAAPGPLPEGLRAFQGNGDLVDLDAVAGGGPVLWLWVDASAPSTAVQLQVLERLIREEGGRGRRGAQLPRDLQWGVVDAGGDGSAFERLVREAGNRNGGLSRVPYRLLNTGGDIRWTQAFDIRSLPATRHTGPGMDPTPEEPPLPGPSLIGWLARRS